MSVIEIGELRLRRQQRVYVGPGAACPHTNLSLEDHGDVVRCVDCKTQVSAFWALSLMSDYWEKQKAKLDRERADLEAAKAHQAHLIAVKRVEKLWRSGMAPHCPHCSTPVLPEDGMGTGAVSMELIRAARKRAKEAKKGQTP